MNKDCDRSHDHNALTDSYTIFQRFKGFRSTTEGNKVSGFLSFMRPSLSLPQVSIIRQIPGTVPGYCHVGM